MRSPNSRLTRRTVGFLGVVVVACVLAGCREYWDRRETMTLEVGDAIAVNNATQTIDRWPRASAHDRWLWDGERARVAVKNYRTRKGKDPQATPGSDTQNDAKPKGTDQ